MKKGAAGYYGEKGHECEVIAAIHRWGLGYNLGNVLKYIARAGKKNPATFVEDLQKALVYLEYATQYGSEKFVGDVFDFKDDMRRCFAHWNLDNRMLRFAVENVVLNGSKNRCLKRAKVFLDRAIATYGVHAPLDDGIEGFDEIGAGDEAGYLSN